MLVSQGKWQVVETHGRLETERGWVREGESLPMAAAAALPPRTA